MNNPQVTVIIPTYKRSLYLGRAIESVLSQSYSNIQIIIVDDNNPEDEFRKKTESLMSQYLNNSAVVYLQHEKNKNGAAARNTGIKYSNAEYIAFLDDDDFYKPDKILNQMNVLQRRDETWGGCCCFHSRRYKSYAYAIYSVNKNNTGKYSKEFLIGETSTPSSTLLVRASVFQHIGNFDESFERHQDLEFLMRFYRSYKMKVSCNFDVCMQTEGFRNYPNSQKAFEIKSKFLNTFQEDIGLFDKKEQSLIYKNQWFEVACLFLKDRDLKNAFRLFKKHVFVKGQIKLIDYVRVSFFLITGYFPVIRKITSYILGITLYRNY